MHSEYVVSVLRHMDSYGDQTGQVMVEWVLLDDGYEEDSDLVAVHKGGHMPLGYAQSLAEEFRAEIKRGECLDTTQWVFDSIDFAHASRGVGTSGGRRGSHRMRSAN